MSKVLLIVITLSPLVISMIVGWYYSNKEREERERMKLIDRICRDEIDDSVYSCTLTSSESRLQRRSGRPRFKR